MTGDAPSVIASAGTSRIDLTEEMVVNSGRLIEQNGPYTNPVNAIQMDAEKLDFLDVIFDVVISRNLTWTLPDPEKAYRAWHRVLRPGGVLLNFDAAYAENVRNRNQRKSHVTDKDVYGHIGITPALSAENAEITLAVPASRHTRPAWDMELAKAAGFSAVAADEDAGKRILRERDLADAPLFLLSAVK